MMNAEQAESEAERRFPEYTAEVMSTCGIYRLALSPRMQAWQELRIAGVYDPTDPRLYSEGNSYEEALHAAKPPALAELQILSHAHSPAPHASAPSSNNTR